MSTPENHINDPGTEDFQDDSIAYKFVSATFDYFNSFNRKRRNLHDIVTKLVNIGDVKLTEILLLFTVNEQNCRLDWSELLKEDPAQHKEESSKELDEIMSLLKQYNEDPDLPACQPIAPSIPRRKPKKRACSSPEIHGPRPKSIKSILIVNECLVESEANLRNKELDEKSPFYYYILS